jgi:hypothetical protein
MLKKLFHDHPASVGESYLQHAQSAGSFAGALLVAACACAIHALLPFVFEKTASRAVTTLHDRMVINRHRQSRMSSQSIGATHSPATTPNRRLAS